MFFDRFVEKCNEHGIAPTTAVIEMGFNKSQVTRWQTSTPRKSSLLKVANYFNCSVDELLDGEKNKLAPSTGNEQIVLPNKEQMKHFHSEQLLQLIADATEVLKEQAD